VGTDSYSFQVIHTPGHTDGHISLFEPTQGWLFTGDMFISEQIQTMHCEEDVYKMIDSLNRLLQYDFKTLFCASGRVVDNARDAVMAKSLYLEDLGERVRDLDRRGIPPEEIRSQLLGEEGFLNKVSEGEWGKINLVRSYLRSANQVAPLPPENPGVGIASGRVRSLLTQKDESAR
jgi:glyoxylase-like metal-dependent hydrolase (beta-lactamase superfamily II)